MYFIEQDSGDNRLPSINSTNSVFFCFFLKAIRRGLERKRPPTVLCLYETDRTNLYFRHRIVLVGVFCFCFFRCKLHADGGRFMFIFRHRLCIATSTVPPAVVRKTEPELEYAPCLYTNYCRKCSSSTALVTLTYIIRVISAEVPPFPGLPSTNQITTTVIMVES